MTTTLAPLCVSRVAVCSASCIARLTAAVLGGRCSQLRPAWAKGDVAEPADATRRRRQRRAEGERQASTRSIRKLAPSIAAEHVDEIGQRRRQRRVQRVRRVEDEHAAAGQAEALRVGLLHRQAHVQPGLRRERLQAARQLRRLDLADLRVPDHVDPFGEARDRLAQAGDDLGVVAVAFVARVHQHHARGATAAAPARLQADEAVAVVDLARRLPAERRAQDACGRSGAARKRAARPAGAAASARAPASRGTARARRRD